MDHGSWIRFPLSALPLPASPSALTVEDATDLSTLNAEHAYLHPMSWLAQKYLMLRGWTFVGQLPEERKAVIVAAPHTSNWDFPIFLAVARYFGIKPHFLGKDTLFKGVLGILMRRWGGLPVDRSGPNEMVKSAAKHFDSAPEMFLVITPEGTRGAAKVWKSGFWRIADAAGVPVVMGFVDGATKTTGFGPTMYVNGDPHAFMEAVREFYEDINGLKPSKRTPMILASESEEDD
jgi:hypothetical protein